MELGVAEMPLALFSTFAPMGAGAFAVLAVAFLTVPFSDDEVKKLDKLTLIPLCFAVVGFIAAFFHLAAPQHAFGVFAATGSSPLSNELVAGCIFMAAAIIYWIVAMTGKMPAGARKACVLIVAALGLIFAAFTGAAYMMDTIASWNTVLVPLEMVAFALIGGSAVGVMTLGFAGVQEKLSGACNTAIMALAILGAVFGIIFACLQTTGVSSMQNSIMDGAQIVSGVMMWLVCGAVCVAAAGVFATLAMRGKSMVTFGTTATVLAVIGILVLRLVFYATELSVGLAI